MSSGNMETGDQEMNTMPGRIQRMQQQLAEREERARKRVRTLLVVGLVLGSIMVYGFSKLTSLNQEFDATTLVYMGANEAQERLPEARESLHGMLEEQAPSLVARGFEAALDSMPQLREMILSGFNDKLDEINTGFTAEMAVRVRQVLEHSREEIDRAHPNADNREELIARAAAQEFQQAFRTAVDDLYPHYAEEMNRITDSLNEIMTKDPQFLTESERNRRELVETLIRLVRRARKAST